MGRESAGSAATKDAALPDDSLGGIKRPVAVTDLMFSPEFWLFGPGENNNGTISEMANFEGRTIKSTKLSKALLRSL